MTGIGLRGSKVKNPDYIWQRLYFLLILHRSDTVSLSVSERRYTQRNSIGGTCLVNEFDDGSSGNCLTLIMNQNVFVLVGNIDIDDCLRSFKIGILVHIGHGGFSQ